MARYLLLMHGDAVGPEDQEAWGPYLATLRTTGRLLGGSSLGASTSHRRDAPVPPGTSLVGYLLVEAVDAADAASLLAGNPSLAAGGTVEICPLVED